MAELFLLSWITVMFTVIMNLTGIPTCLEIYQSKCTRHVMFLPFVAMSFNNCLWYSYGVFTQDWILKISNLACLSLQLTYVIVFLVYTDSKLFHMFQCGVAALFLTMLLLYFTTSPRSLQSLTNQLGCASMGSTMFMYVSPLMELAAVFRTKSARKISIPLTMASFSCATLWIFYGILVKDLFLAAPNLLGIISSCARFVLVWLYGKGPPRVTNLYGAV